MPLNMLNQLVPVVAFLLLSLSLQCTTLARKDVLVVDADIEDSASSTHWILFRPFAAVSNMSHSSGFEAKDQHGAHQMHKWHEGWWRANRDTLARAFDFRGSYLWFGLVVGDANDVNRLDKMFPGSSSRIIAGYNPASQLWIVECEPRYGPSLIAQVRQIIAETDVTVHDSYQGCNNHTRWVVEGQLDKLFEVTKATFISVPTTPLRPDVDLARNPIYKRYSAQQQQTNTTSTVLAPNPLIEAVLRSVSQERLIDNVNHLSSYVTRQSYSVGALEAQAWLAQEYLKLGYQVITIPFEPRYSDNVIAELKGIENPDNIIILSAHYDSRSTDVQSPTQRAPGADDNGSGTSTLLEIASIIASTGLKFKNTVRFCSWSGEEQGLRGSRAYARQMRAEDANIIAVLNMDMLGWVLPGTQPTFGMKDRFTTEWLLSFVNDITRMYVPNLGVGISNSCCSDHQSFFEEGFPAVGYFENTGRASDYPYYHTSNDLPQYINFQQITLMAKAIAAATLTIADPVVA